ncbi:MAG: tetratricopeptide repeat protein [Pyrinomonadaceae bacterium]
MTSSTFNLVGTIYAKKPDEAEQLARKSLAICRKMLGEKHVDTIWAVYNLAYVLIYRQRYAEAEHHARSAALSCRDANLPDKHPVVASCLLLLRRTLMEQGEFAEARSAFEDCVALRRAALPEDHWLLATTFTFLGECLVYLGEIERGAGMVADNCELLERGLGRAHEQTRLGWERLTNLRKWIRQTSA